MATPLTTLSRYTGFLMVVLCALLMFAFVIGDPLMQYAGGGPGGGTGGGGTVATWDGGSVNERQLDEAVRHRNILAAFQQAVYDVGARSAQAAGIDTRFDTLRVQPLDLPRSRERSVEQNVVQTKVFAERASDAGMVVSDEMIVDYLRAIGRDRVTNDQMRDILAGMKASGGKRATIGFVFDLLREAMLAQNYLRSYSYAFETILPAENWDDWRKANERVVVEAAPIDVAGLVDEVAEPTDEELAEFFAEYRDREPSPEVLTAYGNVELPSPLPAFATPERVKLVYLKADVAAAAAAIEDDVTDEEIAAYYEENKEQFVEADRALFGDDPLGEDEAAGVDLTADDLTAEDAADGDATDAEQADDAAADETATEDALEADSLESDTPKTDDPAAEDPPAADEVEEADPTDASSEANASEPTEAATDEPALDDIGDALEEEEEEEEVADEADDAEEADDTPYQPLEEVADQIRFRLALQKAAADVEKRVTAVKTELDDAFAEYFDAVLSAGDAGADSVEPPALLNDLQPLAEANELELTEVDQASQLAIRETPVGRTVSADPASGRQLPAWFTLFRTSDGKLETYEPVLTFDAVGNPHLVMVTQRYPAEKPELDDIRDEVIAAWKRGEAADLALERGAELAADAAGAGKTLADYFADIEDSPIAPEAVVETDAFTFLTAGMVAPTVRQPVLRLSQPEPLVAPGPELLEAVFELGAGEVVAKANHDRSVVYLLRVAQKIGTDDELRAAFRTRGDRWAGRATLQQARLRRAMSSLALDLLAEADLEWSITPDEMR